jgi:hypothetical protein
MSPLNAFIFPPISPEASGLCKSFTASYKKKQFCFLSDISYSNWYKRTFKNDHKKRDIQI